MGAGKTAEKKTTVLDQSEADCYVAIVECGAGNELTFFRTHICTKTTTIAELMKWKKSLCVQENGDLMISKTT